ncbi:hypothetical protein [Streptomyces musisoli]|uniref:hypothetical protein n=1 Tax=Streptomyces musisoli TaxID=2802280 RepID=UPI003557557E
MVGRPGFDLIRAPPVTQSPRFSDDGLFVVSSGVDSAVRVWEAATDRCIRGLDGHQSGTAELAITPDANFDLTADGDQTLRLWELDWDLTAPCLSG